MDGLDIPAWARSLLDTGRVGRLGLIDEQGGPRVLPVTYVVHDGAVWSAVDDVKAKRRPGAELARLRFARARPAAALTVDRYDDDWSRLAWVQLLGAVSVLDTAGEAVVDALAAKYEPYRARPPAGPFLRLVVERALSWRAGE